MAVNQQADCVFVARRHGVPVRETLGATIDAALDLVRAGRGA